MNLNFIKFLILLLVLAISGCSVDYSILEDRYCNAENRCLPGYKCDLTIRKCVKEDELKDINTYDISSDALLSDRILSEIKDNEHYDTIKDIHYEELEDIDYGDEYTDSFISTDGGIKDYESIDSNIDSGICEAGLYYCIGNDLYICDQNNQLLLETGCQIGCIVDHCMECIPGEKQCEDDENIKICSEDGIFRSEKCGYKCFNNQCVICMPGDKYCENNKAIQCNPTGTKWIETECSIGCYSGDCMICTPDVDSECRGNDIYTCSSTGMEFIKSINCCHDNNCSEGKCIITAPRVIDYNPKDWKVGSTVDWVIEGCFFVANASKVMINYQNSWKEVTEYSNFKYVIRTETRIQIKVDVKTDTEYNFKVVNPDGQESGEYPIKKHWL